MDRKEFLVKIGKGTALAGLAYCVGCSANGSDFPTAPTSVDKSYDLSSSKYGALNNIGGSIVDNGIIIGRIDESTFIAVSAACTHQGTTLKFQLNNNRFYCTNHGSAFDFNGKVTRGPATKALVKYDTSFSDNILKVYS